MKRLFVVTIALIGLVMMFPSKVYPEGSTLPYDGFRLVPYNPFGPISLVDIDSTTIVANDSPNTDNNCHVLSYKSIYYGVLMSSVPLNNQGNVNLLIQIISIITSKF